MKHVIAIAPSTSTRLDPLQLFVNDLPKCCQRRVAMRLWLWRPTACGANGRLLHGLACSDSPLSTAPSHTTATATATRPARHDLRVAASSFVP